MRVSDGSRPGETDNKNVRKKEDAGWPSRC